MNSQTMQMDESQMQMEELELQARMSEISHKLLVLSGKGGVGKSTVAANLAFALAQKGKKVGLLDADLHGPSIPGMLGLKGQRITNDAEHQIHPFELTENLKVVSIALMLSSHKDAVIWRGPMKYSVIRQLLKDVCWGKLDYLVVDLPPGTGDESLSVAQLVGENSSAVIVTTPQDVAISDVRRCISFCHTLELSVAGIIENMSGLICPHCKEKIDLFKTGGGQKLAEEMNVPFLGQIPIEPQIVNCGEQGKPFIKEFTDNPAAKTFGDIVEKISDSAKTIEMEKRTMSNDNNTMHLAIPTANGKLCLHFGHCEKFALVEVDAETQKILDIKYLTPPPHEPGVLPRWLAENGANVIIASGMGQRAQILFTENGIKVVTGAEIGTPEEITAAYLNNTLKVGDNVCAH